VPATALAQLAQILPSLQDRLSESPSRGEAQLSPEENRQRLIDGIVAFLTGLATLRPLVLFLDDLHWANAETLAVVSRLSTRIQRYPLLLLLAYRQGDLVENEDLQTLLHALRRTPYGRRLTVERFSLEDVRTLVRQLSSETANMGETPPEQLAQALYEITAGNALFITEAIRALRERAQDRTQAPATYPIRQKEDGYLDTLSRRERVQEIIAERIERLPATALGVLHLAAVIGRDFSLELLERAATSDPAAGLDVLLRRQFLVERLDERLDFVHQIVRQVAYDGLNTLLRRRIHHQVAVALAESHRNNRNPTEIAFHYGEAGLLYRPEYARYSVLAGEKLLLTFSLQGALAQFDNALHALEALPESEPELMSRALQGRGLVYENLLDPDGVTETYTRLRQWALSIGDKDLALMAHTRLTTLLGLVGQQAESNALMADLILDRRSTPVPSLADLLARHQLLFSQEESPPPDDEWTSLQAPAPVPADPVGEITAAMGPAQAALPLLIYGWALQVQGQFVESARVLEAAVAISEETGQRALASLAYHQLAVTIRLQGDPQRSRALNEQSKAINQQVHGTAAQLAGLWPRISSAYEALARGELTLAANRLQRVETFLADRDSFRTHLNSTIIGLGLVALAQGDLRGADELLERGLADPHNRYPFTFVKGLLGQAHIAHQRGEQQRCEAILRRALHYAGRRSLVREYAECVEVIAALAPTHAPIVRLQRETMAHLERTGLIAIHTASG
jgi:tetratricopeptide (TPR) repeat protein